MTLRLYYTDSYLRDFDAAVVDRADGGRRVYLDRTAFYPTSGGQPYDTGTLGGAAVVDVVDEGDRIAHLLADPIDGTTVHGERGLAPPLRPHAAAHRPAPPLGRARTSSSATARSAVHFGRESSTLDLDTPDLEQARLVEAEGRANEIVAENRPVEVSFEEAAEADRPPEGDRPERERSAS